jgi:hypothetical protein
LELFKPFYSLQLLPDADGLYTKATVPLPYRGTDSPGYLDAFRKDRAPTPTEMVAENLNTAYACSHLNGLGVAGTKLGLYAQSRGTMDEGRAKRAREWGAVRKIGRKQARRLKALPYIAQQVAGADEIEEVVQHPFLTLLRNPVPEDRSITGTDLIYLTSVYLDTLGWELWYIDLSGPGGTPRAFWPLMPQHVNECAEDPTDPLVDYYEYGGTDGERFDPNEVSIFRFPDPKNPFRRGMAPLRAVIEQVKLQRKSDAQTNARLDNAGRPDAIFSPKGTDDGYGIDGPQATRLEAKFRQRFSRAGVGGVMVSETPGALTPLSWPMKDLYDLEQARLTKTAICNAYGVPDTKLNRNDANLAGAKTGDYAHAKDAIEPRCNLIAAAINNFILPHYDPTGRLFVAFDSPVESERDADREDDKVLVSMGGLTVNEYRGRVGLPEIEGGDQRLVPNNLVPVDATGKPIAAPSLGGLLGTAGDSTTADPTADPNAPESQPQDGVTIRDTGDAVSVSTQVLALQEAFSRGDVTRESAIANAVLVFGYSDAEAGVLFPEKQAETTTTQLNGAQVSAASAIVTAVAAGDIPRDAGIGQLTQFFGLTPEAADAVMGSAGNSNVPTTPNPRPAVEGDNNTQPNNTPDAQPNDAAKSFAPPDSVRQAAKLGLALLQYPIAAKAEPPQPFVVSPSFTVNLPAMQPSFTVEPSPAPNVTVEPAQVNVAAPSVSVAAPIIKNSIELPPRRIEVSRGKDGKIDSATIE